MKIFYNNRLAIAYKQLQKEVRKLKSKQTIEKVQYDNVTSVGLLFEAKEETDIVNIENFIQTLEKEHKKVKALGIISEKLLESIKKPLHGVEFFTFKDVNWKLAPEHENVKKFIISELDMLINLSMGKCFPMTFIAAHTPARFRIGEFQPASSFVYDFMIDNGESNELSRFITNVSHYLNLLKK